MEDINLQNNEQRFIGNHDEYRLQINGVSDNIETQITARKQNEMTEGMQKYMPIGSIISLSGQDDLIMIVGFNYNSNDITSDYLGCTYPFGIDNVHKSFVFNHEQIDKVYHIGYINNLERHFKSQLDQKTSNDKGILR